MALEKINLSQTKNFTLNALPVTTWRWLKVNHLELTDFALPITTQKISPAISCESPHNTIVKEIYEDTNKYLFLEKHFTDASEYGVSKDFFDYGREHYNSGVLIQVPRGEKLNSPIRIQYESSKDAPFIIDNNLIIAEENSEVTVIFEYSSSDASAAFHNGITRIYAKTGAIVHCIKSQIMNEVSDHFDSTIAYIEQDAKVNFISIELGSKRSVSNYLSNLKETASEANLKSIYIGKEKQNIDLSYIMNHYGRKSVSTIETRGVLKDFAKKTFRGTLDFKKGSHGAKGSEQEYALLLDPNVKCDAIPLLLCGEDDVEGQHAASAGKIDEQKLFYLMSRGFTEKEAKQIIVEGSLRPILDLIPIQELQQKIQEEIQRRLIHE